MPKWHLLLNSAVTERREKEISLSKANNNLESIVEERTREVNKTNEQLQKQNKELSLSKDMLSYCLSKFSNILDDKFFWN